MEMMSNAINRQTTKLDPERAFSNLQEKTRKMASMIGELQSQKTTTPAYRDLQNYVNDIITEQELLRVRMVNIEQRLALYRSFEAILDTPARPSVSQTIDLAQAVIEQAQTEAHRIIQEAQRKSAQIVLEARLNSDQNTSKTPVAIPSQNATFINDAPVQPKTASQVSQPLMYNTEGQTEFIVTGLKNFTQAVEFQKALMAVPEVLFAKVRVVHQGIMNMEVRHHPNIDLSERLTMLPGFSLSLTGRSQGTLKVEVKTRATSAVA